MCELQSVPAGDSDPSCYVHFGSISHCDNGLLQIGDKHLLLCVSLCDTVTFAWDSEGLVKL